ncbi:DEAD/DEAH box helicase [Flavobacteriaceae bacterium]|nr:DEAD/DEAH box helicase [Flavobacteriaceae bacterium]
MVTLRPHQEDAVEALRDSFRQGNLRPVLGAPCSMGKTHIAIHVMMKAAEQGRTAVFFCDRLKLLQQTCDAFDAMGADYSVLQADDPRYDPNKKIQIASIQTALKRKNFWFNFAVVDECHTLYKGMMELMRKYTAVPFLGLSATPFSRGMACEGLYDDLIVTTTPRDLIAKGYLCPTDYYIGRSVSSEGIKTKALRTGSSDYDGDSLGQKMLEDDTLAGDIVKNYLDHSNNLQKRAVCYAPSIAYSKTLVDRFNAEIGQEVACHIDGYMDPVERELIHQDFQNGVYKILVNSKLLNTGWDDPGVEILIDCYKTKSRIAWIQRIGRVWRTSPGKERAIVLDHAGNLEYFSVFPEDVVPYKLDDKEKTYSEQDQVKKEEKELIVRQCPQCSAAFSGRVCGACGYVLPPEAKIIKDDGTKLKLAKNLSSSERRRTELTKEDKQKWYGSLLWYGNQHGYKKGWAYHKYIEAMSCAPNGLKQSMCNPTSEVISWITSKNIRYSKTKWGK